MIFRAPLTIRHALLSRHRFRYAAYMLITRLMPHFFRRCHALIERFEPLRCYHACHYH